MKKALLCVSFGTSVPEARGSIEAVEAALKRTAPDRRLARAFTSTIIRRLLSARGEEIPGVSGALEQLAEQGVEDVLVQPTHILFGNEYEKICREMAPWKDRFAALTLGPPLLGGTDDLRQLAQVLSAAWPAQEDEALVLFGHGTDHFANVMYAALQTVFQIQGREDVLVGTVEGWPAYEEVSAQLRRSGRRRIRLAPLMLVAGDHALNDMAGPEDSCAARCRAWVSCGAYRRCTAAIWSRCCGGRRQMAFEHYIRSGQKWLRQGYTTGTCAALAAAGATRFLLTGSPPQTAALVTPKGLEVEAPLLRQALKGDCASCAVEKDGGDDPDVTHGCLIFADVARIAAGVEIDGGEGVGRVTRRGLDQPVGAAAINHVPRQMIAAAVERECRAAGYNGGIRVVIRIPGGEELARRTFNPHLGIEGGLSILGTSGVVEPMSQQALVDTIGVELRQARAYGADRLLLTPGNYGLDFLCRSGLELPGVPCVKCSNFLGEALDMAGGEGFSAVVVVSHAGKLVKVAGGVMNTHSRLADCRMEILVAHAAVQGADQVLCRRLMEVATVDAGIALLEEAGR